MIILRRYKQYILKQYYKNKGVLGTVVRWEINELKIGHTTEIHSRCEFLLQSFGINYKIMLIVYGSGMIELMRITKYKKDLMNFSYWDALYHASCEYKYLIITYANVKRSKIHLNECWYYDKIDSTKIIYHKGPMEINKGIMCNYTAKIEF